MSESKHTPGKLSLNNYHYPYAYLVIRKGSGDNDAFPRPRKICDVTLDGKTEKEYEANARHLVKCWNSHDALLDACKEVSVGLCHVLTRDKPGWLMRVEAAIVQAEKEGSAT